MVTHMLYAASLGDTAAITVLLDDGADVNSADYDGRSALHLASSEGRLETVDLLLRKGARVNAKDRWTHTVWRRQLSRRNIRLQQGKENREGGLSFLEVGFEN